VGGEAASTFHPDSRPGHKKPLCFLCATTTTMTMSPRRRCLLLWQNRLVFGGRESTCRPFVVLESWFRMQSVASSTTQARPPQHHHGYSRHDTPHRSHGTHRSKRRTRYLRYVLGAGSSFGPGAVSGRCWLVVVCRRILFRIPAHYNASMSNHALEAFLRGGLRSNYERPRQLAWRIDVCAVWIFP
jgi:hypothetical protein